MSSRPPASKSRKIPPKARIAVIAARFNEAIVDELLNGCLSRLAESGITAKNVTVNRVPGAFELPLAAKWAARSKKYAAVICLGAVIRGETPHFDFVAGESARGIQQVAIDEGLPVIFGVLTTNTQAQANDRVGGKHGHAGKRAAEAALEMIELKNKI
jgi:6,7-dimethyl-8-ribityllumazine synthase